MTGMKSYWKPLLTGIIVAALMVLVMLKVTMNFQVLLFLGTALFFAAGLLHARKDTHYLATALAVSVFYVVFFALIVLEELPQLWYFIPVYLAGSLLGVLFRKHRTKAGVASMALVAGMLFITLVMIPRDLEHMLAKERNDTLPEFTIQHLNGETTDSRSLAGKVVVLDFFGTWCKPCILELRELDKVKEAFDEDEVVFYVINADQGKDTPEKFEAFIKKHDYTFNFAYDHNSEIFKKLEMDHLGLPTLLVIDKEQLIRYQHVGYNPAETHFRDRLIETINGLK
jgi:peroxiredoxin